MSQHLEGMGWGLIGIVKERHALITDFCMTSSHIACFTPSSGAAGLQARFEHASVHNHIHNLLPFTQVKYRKIKYFQAILRQFV